MQNDRGTHIWKYNRLPRYYLTIMSASRMKLHQPTPEVFHECFTWKCSLRLEEEILKQSWSFAPLRVYTIRQTLGGADSLPETNSSSRHWILAGPQKEFWIFQHLPTFHFQVRTVGCREGFSVSQRDPWLPNIPRFRQNLADLKRSGSFQPWKNPVHV